MSGARPWRVWYKFWPSKCRSYWYHASYESQKNAEKAARKMAKLALTSKRLGDLLSPIVVTGPGGFSGGAFPFMEWTLKLERGDGEVIETGPTCLVQEVRS